MELSGSADGVDRLYRETREALAGYFQRRHRTAHGVEDLLHETFLRLMRRADRLREARSPRAYVFGIARHVSADAWRRADPPAADGEALDLVAAAEPDPRLAAAREVIAGLPHLQREILDLRFQHDLSYAEIAEALGVPVGTVRSRLHNAMRILRARLALEESASDGSHDDEA
ncbi:MAG: sigma-70 family RNA polymerase sigma factor [Verrucomicrobia bacterium]|nr:sigma-70 family RNA polymerase sigma factor [Verrucomicrobiota bacterium]